MMNWTKTKITKKFRMTSQRRTIFSKVQFSMPFIFSIHTLMRVSRTRFQSFSHADRIWTRVGSKSGPLFGLHHPFSRLCHSSILTISQCNGTTPFHVCRKAAAAVTDEIVGTTEKIRPRTHTEEARNVRRQHSDPIRRQQQQQQTAKRTLRFCFASAAFNRLHRVAYSSLILTETMP